MTDITNPSSGLGAEKCRCIDTNVPKTCIHMNSWLHINLDCTECLTSLHDSQFYGICMLENVDCSS